MNWREKLDVGSTLLATAFILIGTVLLALYIQYSGKAWFPVFTTWTAFAMVSLFFVLATKHTVLDVAIIIAIPLGGIYLYDQVNNPQPLAEVAQAIGSIPAWQIDLGLLSAGLLLGGIIGFRLGRRH